eukprot:TRINITY_DN936_c0_g1_i6.p1 TRINITY_DN936_c0_g1~~TRINITY_DN936_c0_g1_i6.p1  ORF type:complete len:114 (-),score=1.86 TRINITY_DN936_c0_g1_i6:196-537(-)
MEQPNNQTSTICSPKLATICSVFVLILAAVLLAIAIVFPSFLENTLESTVISSRKLIDDSLGLQSFMGNTAPGTPKTLLNFYFWNVTNKDDFLHGEKPMLQQVLIIYIAYFGY